MFRKRKKIEIIQLKTVNEPKSVGKFHMPFGYDFKGTNRKDYRILWDYNKESTWLEIRVYDKENEIILDGGLYSNIISNKNDVAINKYWNLKEINVKENKRMGFGTALMKAYFEILGYLYNEGIKINIVKGKIVPEMELKDAEKFYKTFDNYATSTQVLVEMRYEHENQKLMYNLKTMKPKK